LPPLPQRLVVFVAERRGPVARRFNAGSNHPKPIEDFVAERRRLVARRFNAGLQHTILPESRRDDGNEIFMPQTFTQLHYHIIFSTKRREHQSRIRERVWDYLGGIVKGEGAIPILIGEVADHIHMLCTLCPTHSLASFIQKLKGNSSKWALETLPQHSLWWQTGYGAFTVSHSSVDAVRDYIVRQEEHHRQLSFQDEYRQFLRKHGIEPDEKYMWE
jgi:REP element-mobilizing transposase RayT